MSLDLLNGVEQFAAPGLQPALNSAAPSTPELEAQAAAQRAAGQAAGDLVDISNEAQQLAGQADADEAGQEPQAVFDPALYQESAQDLQQELTRVNRDVAVAQAELDELQRQAQEDATRQAALSQKQAELRDLQNQAADLQRRVFI